MILFLDKKSLVSHNAVKLHGLGNDRMIHKIAFCGGSGNGCVEAFVQSEAELLITGELGYHQSLLCEYHQKSVLLMGHKQSEVFVLDEIKSRLVNAFPDLVCCVVMGKADS